jgi:hypothetical protein
VATGSWTIVQPGIPDVFTDVIETIQSLLNALLAILNIILAVLQIVKAFIAGLLNPLDALINAIIAEIEALLNDIRQIGIYISGDLELDPPDFSDIIGGYTAYERRMIGRLVNRQDPTRPAFTSRSAVIAIFIYVSVDISGLAQLIKIIQAILAFFGQRVDMRVTSVPVSLQVTYGVEGAPLSAFKQLTGALREGEVPNQANLRWVMAPTSQAARFMAPGPKGFLIEVSTLRDGLFLAYDTYAANTPVGPGINTRRQGLIRDPRTGLPFRLYGGPDLIDVGDLMNAPFKEDVDGTNRVTRLYAYRDSSDNNPIPIGAMLDGEKYLLQRAFFVKAGFLNVAAPGQGFAATLAHEDMPWEADFEVQGDGKVKGTAHGDSPATTVYVRISQVTETIVDEVVTTGGQGKTGALTAPLILWETTANDVSTKAERPGTVLLTTGLNFNVGDKGLPSEPLEVTFPATSTLDYINAITAALAVLVLARCDLPVAAGEAVFADGQAAAATGLEEVGRFLIPQLIKENRATYYGKLSVAPEDFRRNLRRRCRVFANYIYRTTGPMGELEKTVVELAKPLLEFKWSTQSGLPDLTILESLEASNVDSGIALNPLCLGRNDRATRALYRAEIGPKPARAPFFREKKVVLKVGWLEGQGSADMSPVIYSLPIPHQVSFCRNVITSEVYGSAAAVLNVAACVVTLQRNKSGDWKAFRLFPQGLPPIEALLDEILRWVKAIQAGIKGFVDIIIAYINFLQARILELQALIVRINGLLDALTGFNLPAMSALIVTANGTDGILQALISADNKPSDSTASEDLEVGDSEITFGTYGAGVVLLAGGLPTVLAELLASLFPEAE